MIDLHEIQKPLRNRYLREPGAARYTYAVGLSAAELDLPMHATAQSLGHAGPDYRVHVNERIGGSGREPTPGDVLLAALATCKAISVKMVAAALRIELTGLEVHVSGDLDHRGVLLMPGGARPGFEAIRCVVRLSVAPGTDPDAVRRLEHASDACCAVTDTIKNATPLTSTFEMR